MDVRRLIVACVVPLALAGCTMQPAPQTTVTVQAMPPSAASMPMNNESAFDAAFVVQFTKMFGYAPTQEVIVASRKVGHATCDALNAGVTSDKIVMTLLESATTQDGRNMLLVAAGVGVGVYCPEHIKDFG
jgi:hypothetical protein